MKCLKKIDKKTKRHKKINKYFNKWPKLYSFLNSTQTRQNAYLFCFYPTMSITLIYWYWYWIGFWGAIKIYPFVWFCFIVSIDKINDCSLHLILNSDKKIFWIDLRWYRRPNLYYNWEENIFLKFRIFLSLLKSLKLDFWPSCVLCYFDFHRTSRAGLILRIVQKCFGPFQFWHSTNFIWNLENRTLDSLNLVGWTQYKFESRSFLHV